MEIHRLFRVTKHEIPAGTSGKISLQSAALLWCCFMGVNDIQPNSDNLLQCELKFSAVDWFFSNSDAFRTNKRNAFQPYLLEFGQTMDETFNMDVTTKLHRSMRHVADHLIFLMSAP